MKRLLSDAARSDGCVGIGPMRISSCLQRLNYFIRIPNVGELVNLALVTAITCVHTVYSKDGGGYLLAIGSILGAAPTSIHVLGIKSYAPILGGVRSLLSAFMRSAAGFPCRHAQCGLGALRRSARRSGVSGATAAGGTRSSEAGLPALNNASLCRLTEAAYRQDLSSARCETP